MDQQNQQNIEAKNKKNALIVIFGLLLLLILIIIWYWGVKKTVVPPEMTPSISPSPTPSPTQSVSLKEDSISAINEELNSIDLGDLEKEFQTIDADLNAL